MKARVTKWSKTSPPGCGGEAPALKKALFTGACAAIVLATSPAHAIDIPKLVLGKPITIDVTEVSIVAQRFDSREVNPITEGGGWGQWINRLNVKVDWNHFTVGMRLDSAVYWNTLAQQCSNINNVVPSSDPMATSCKALNTNILQDDLTRYQNTIYPAKLWATYSNKKLGLEVTLGDAYVQFARGLVLSMRKLDDLGIDSTLRGIKASVVKGPFGFTLVAGMANPSRVDEATGQALFLEKSGVTDKTSPVFNTRLQQPVFGADQIFGAELQAGRQSPVVLTTSFSYVNRCAPNNYIPTGAAAGRIFSSGTATDLFGACDDADVADWLGSLPSGGSADRQARHVMNVAQSIEFPQLGKFGSLYVVGAIQHLDGLGTDPAILNMDPTHYRRDGGTALYATYAVSIGKSVNHTIEFKDYRNFYPTAASINSTQVGAFSTWSWSAVPTIESITQDNLFGNFNVCVDGLRNRTDVRVNPHLLLFGQTIFTYTKGEQNGVCDSSGNLIAPPTGQAALSDYVFDILTGAQYEINDKTTLNGTLGGRQDWLGTGDTYVNQLEMTYTFSRKLSQTVALELIGRHRIRKEVSQNVGPMGLPEAWVEGENYTGLSIAPHFVFTQGFEYTTQNLPPSGSTKFAFIDSYPAWLYLSLGGVYKFTKNSNIRVFVGQQRGGLKCISGVCRIFPAFEGARMELTLRF